MAAQEPRPAYWVLVDPADRPYGVVELVRRGPEIGYRATTWGTEQVGREVIGYFVTLRGACKAVHDRYIAARSRPGHPPNPWPLAPAAPPPGADPTPT